MKQAVTKYELAGCAGHPVALYEHGTIFSSYGPGWPLRTARSEGVKENQKARENPMSLTGVRPEKPWTAGEYVALGLVLGGCTALGYLIYNQQKAAAATATAAAAAPTPAS